MAPETVAITETVETPKPRDQRALNAYRHGLTGQVLIIPPAEKVAYEKHCQGFQESFAPKGAVEIDLVQSIADDRWRIKRAAAMDHSIHALSAADPAEITAHHEEIDTALAMAITWIKEGKNLQLLTLYESRLQRKVEKNMALLRQMQQERRDALQQALEEAAILGEAYDFPAEALPPQFDFSPQQFARLAAHRRRLNEAGMRRGTPQKPLRRAA